jgi:hypothetical protein
MYLVIGICTGHAAFTIDSVVKHEVILRNHQPYSVLVAQFLSTLKQDVICFYETSAVITILLSLSLQ